MLTCVLTAPAAIAQTRPVVTVYAAASLKEGLDDLALQFAKQGGAAVRVSYAASSALARQIENGAPSDVFISADIEWMDYLDKRKLIQSASRVNLLSNRLVLIAPADSKSPIVIASNFPLAKALGGGRLAMADPGSVPAGKYAKAALESLGVWHQLAPRLAPAENVRAALALVARGEVPFGIVYSSDALAEPKVRVAGLFPLNIYPPIVYPAALVAQSRSKAATSLLLFLRSSEAHSVWRKYGFVVEL